MNAQFSTVDGEKVSEVEVPDDLNMKDGVVPQQTIKVGKQRMDGGPFSITRVSVRMMKGFWPDSSPARGHVRYHASDQGSNQTLYGIRSPQGKSLL